VRILCACNYIGTACRFLFRCNKIKIRELNEDAYSDLVLSIDTSTSAGKVAFSYVRGTKTAEYEDGNAEVAFARLCNKYAPKAAPSLAKTNRLFYQAKLKKQVDPDNFITYLEGLRTLRYGKLHHRQAIYNACDEQS
jgi:hypothetical protein